MNSMSIYKSKGFFLRSKFNYHTLSLFMVILVAILLPVACFPTSEDKDIVKAECHENECVPEGRCIIEEDLKRCICKRGWITVEPNLFSVYCVEDPGGSPGSTCSVNADCLKEDICFFDDEHDLHYCSNRCSSDSDCTELEGGTATCCEIKHIDNLDDKFCVICAD